MAFGLNLQVSNYFGLLNIVYIATKVKTVPRILKKKTKMLIIKTLWGILKRNTK